MPANLTPDYLAAEQEYKGAITREEKLAALDKMLATLPKHKGTEKLQADIRHRMAEARRESAKKGAAHTAPFWLIKHEGAGQVALLGPPNSGKSQLVSSLTHARPEVAEYPFTTRVPVPGMMRFEDVQIQVLDLPPLSPEFTEDWMPHVIRRADAAVLVVDVNDPAVLDEVEFAATYLEQQALARPRILLGNKVDVQGGRENFAALVELLGQGWRTLAVSALTGEGLDAVARTVFEELGIVRVYTKVPGKKAEMGAPYVLKRGNTVIDAARHVHKDFAEHLKFARLYHSGTGRDGLMVERTHVVRDGDVLEFHL
jgi:small GTP-binding protein